MNLIDSCPSATLTAPADPNYLHELGVPSLTVTIPLPTSSLLHCSTFTSSLPISNTLMFSYASVSHSFTRITSLDISQIGTYTMTATAIIDMFGT